MHTSTLLLILSSISSTLATNPRALNHRDIIAARNEVELGAKSLPAGQDDAFVPRDNSVSTGVMKKVRRKRACVPRASGVTSSSSATSSSTSSPASSTIVNLVASAKSSSSSALSSSSSSTQTSSTVVVSTSTTSSAASSTTTTANISGTGSRLFQLFPTGYGQADWTTCPDSNFALSFTGALKPLTAGTLPKTANAPDGTSALVANYPAGTVQYSSATGHGYSFYTQGEHNNVIVTGAKEVLFSYSVYFPAGFQFNKGGKMPGLYGGTSLAQAKSCSGGRQNDRDSCFSARLMWRTNGAGEFYNYYPTSISQTGSYCTTAPYSICDTVYGDSIGRGSFTWATGQWTTVAQRFKLNDVGKANGEQQLYVNGVSILNLSELQVATSSDTKIYGIMAQTFFGGSDSTWASPVDQSAYFKDWSMAVLA